MKANKIYFLSAFALAALMVSFASCRKKGDTIAKVHVRDTANYPVSGARVILFGEQSSDTINHLGIIRNDTGYTDATGWVTFNYNEEYQLGQAGFAILNIYATKDSLEGLGIIRIEEEETNEETVHLQPM